MLICLEGVDGSLKSSFATEIKRILIDRGVTCDVWRRGRPDLNVSPIVEYCEDLQLHSVGAEPHLVLDRWHVGEAIYGPLYRGCSRLTPAVRVFIDGMLASHGALFVHLTADEKTIACRCAHRGEDFLKPDHVQHVIDRYHVETRDVRYWRTVSTTGFKPGAALDTVADVLIDLAQLRESLARPIFSLDTGYIGPQRPEVLLVGDQPSRGALTAPAFWPTHGGSGEYLLEALCDVGLLEPGIVPRLGWVNSCAIDLSTLHRALGEPRVVPLGDAAMERCVAARLSPIMDGVPHPQYQRRFRHHDRFAYGQLIKSAITPLPVS